MRDFGGGRSGGDADGDAGPSRSPGKRTLTETIRRKASGPAAASPEAERAAFTEATAGPSERLPFREELEQSLGVPLDGVRAHVGGSAAEAGLSALGARGAASGSTVAFRDAAPSLHVVAHEVAHTVQDGAAVRGYGSGADAYEAHADAVADRVVGGQSARDLLGPGAGAGGDDVLRRYGDEHREPNDPAAAAPQADRSARFENDPNLASVRGGATTVHRGERGLSVTKLQQALIDLGYLLPRFGVDGIFEGETRAAVVRFQHDTHLPETGELDQATIDALHTRYDSRAPYVAAAAHDPAHPGTRALSAADGAAARDAMLPPRGAAGAAFQETIATNPDSYGTRIRAQLTTLIARFHTRSAAHAPLRANPANLDSWSTIEGPARAAKQATDTVYASNYGGAAAHPPLTHAGGNLLDRWEDESAVQGAMTAPQRRDHAIELVRYLIDANCTDINREHSAVPSAAQESAILAPIVDSFVDTPAKVQILNDIDLDWPGTQLNGVVALQRFRSQNADPAAAQEENRTRLWRLFHTSIHEYLHVLTHPQYAAWARTLDGSREHTLMEGFCDFFTLNVRSALALTPPMIADIEGPYANGNAPPALNPATYASHAQAEQVVSIVGIRNAQAAYFRGDTAAIGGP